MATAVTSPAQAREIVARVWAYLAHHLSYMGNERGVHAYVPAPVGEIFQAGQGDCKDGALLLASWLRAVGIEADLALVRTPAMGRLAPARDGHVAATMAAFDHALVYIPLTGQWIDTTAPRRLDSELPEADQNSLALIVRVGQSGLVRVPAAAAAANLTRRELRLQPAGAGWLQATGTIAVQGAGAPSLRGAYASPAQRQAKLQAWLEGLFPGAEVGAVEATGITPPAAAVTLRFQARIPAAPLTVAWARQHFAQELAQPGSRSQWLDIPARFQSEDSLSLNLGSAGCARQALPQPVHRSGPFGEVEVSAACKDGWLLVHSTVQQLAERIQPAQYAGFRAFWQAVDATLSAPVPTLLASAQVAAR
ncbi:MAG TPA: transglutaminase domain-containing protein [Terriglobales bacterium]|nr:transglutaminase domain-containing protein [Terriglobales bacterium]